MEELKMSNECVIRKEEKIGTYQIMFKNLIRKEREMKILNGYYSRCVGRCLIQKTSSFGRRWEM
jgi:hypothetical protein